MNRDELLKISSKSYISNNATAKMLVRGGAMLLAEAAVPRAGNIDFSMVDGCRVCYDSDGLHVIYHDASGEFICRCRSAYAVGDYVYVRESFCDEGGNIIYLTEWKPGGEFLKHRVTVSRYMPKKYARLFFRVRGVRLKRLFDFNSAELRQYGFDDYNRYFALYNSTLSERQYTMARSELNPYVFVYDIVVENLS